MKSLMGLWLRSWIRRCIHWSAPLIIEEIEKYQLERLRRRLGVEDKEFFAQWPITLTGEVMVGERVSIAAYTHIWGEGGVSIGNRVMIGSHVAIISITHNYAIRIMKGTSLRKSINIEDDVWVGAHSIILPGVTIGSGSVVGAGSLVTKDVEPMTIVMGVPARVHKIRDFDKNE